MNCGRIWDQIPRHSRAGGNPETTLSATIIGLSATEDRVPACAGMTEAQAVNVLRMQHHFGSSNCLFADKIKYAFPLLLRDF